MFFNRKKCVENLGSPSVIDDSNICAGDDNFEKDTCQGDSGGPLVCENQGSWHLEGVTSWGWGCADTTYGVYAKVRHVQAWVSGTIATK